VITVRHNLPDFRRQMAQVGRDFIPIVTASERAAASEIAKAVRRLAPRDTGRLRRAVVIKRARRVPRGTIHYIVGIRQGKSQQRLIRRRKGQPTSVNLDAFYWRFLEKGWKPRRPKSGRPSTGMNRGLVRRQFIAPAFQSSAGRALSAFYSKMETATAKWQAIR
jgi:hypothetical protein